MHRSVIWPFLLISEPLDFTAFQRFQGSPVSNKESTTLRAVPLVAILNRAHHSKPGTLAVSGFAIRVIRRGENSREFARTCPDDCQTRSAMAESWKVPWQECP